MKSVPLFPINPIKPVEVGFQRREGNRIRCEICPHYCKLGEGDVGICGGRSVINGRFIATNYAQVSSLQLDSIEKKPFYHFFPGSDILSVGPNGCNLSCAWCQNWELSQNNAPTRILQPTELADMIDAIDGIGAAYTYAEPLIWFEYLRDAGRILHERGLMNLFVTNGFINAKPLQELLPISDAFNVDLKTTDDGTFCHYCKGHLEDVKRNIYAIYDAGKHLEITHLLVTGVNDNLHNIEAVVNWVSALDPAIPLHLIRYYPSNHYDKPPTSHQFMKEAYRLARSELSYVYLGNTSAGDEQNSYCPECGSLLVKRDGSHVEMVGLDGNRCTNCKKELDFHVDVDEKAAATRVFPIVCERLRIN
ncbi:MAG: AmmeMemoRadiSam system radical SAM enzyme [Candidatus Electryoneaceae bacterium]|nr:AmmeMemoRadiSam system radical SAM enzyme [Candidatus Electryoneaceae bacterium]